MLATFSVLLMILLLKKMRRFEENFILIFIKVHLRWNFVLRTFLQSVGPLSLAVFLQFRVFNFNHVYTNLCGSLAIFSGLYLLLMGVLVIRFLATRSVSHLKVEYVKKQYETLYEGILLRTSAEKYYYVCLMVRDVLITLLITFVVKLPLLQITCLIFYNVFLVVYIFKYVAFEDWRLTYINRANQVIILVTELCILLLNFKFKVELYYDILAWLIVGMIGTAILAEVLYVVGMQLYEIRTLYQRILSLMKGLKNLVSSRVALAYRRIRVRKVRRLAMPNANNVANITNVSQDTSVCNNN